jgi:hypothetical protein
VDPGPAGVEEIGRGVYVMRTFRDFRHMGSVLCVTFQGPASQERVGGGIWGLSGEGGVVEVEGERKGSGGGVVMVGVD